MKTLLVWISGIVIFSGCSSNNSNFRLEKLADLDFEIVNIPENTRINILSYSGGPVCTPDVTYYHQYIGVINETSDTVRILSICPPIAEGEPQKQGNFSSWDSTSKVLKETME